MAVQYTDQTLTVPADICAILERESLLDSGCDDFGLNIEVENGQLMITDMLEYITKGYKTMQPEDAWVLVREWWAEVKEAKKYRMAISNKQREVAKLQNEIANNNKDIIFYHFYNVDYRIPVDYFFLH